MKIQTHQPLYVHLNTCKKNAKYVRQEKMANYRHKKPDGSLGHKGVSRKYNLTNTVKHIMKNTKCSCDSTMEYSYTKTRDIIDYIPAVATEIKHMIDAHVCSNCKHVHKAENDLSKSDSYVKNGIA